MLKVSQLSEAEVGFEPAQNQESGSMFLFEYWKAFRVDFSGSLPIPPLLSPERRGFFALYPLSPSQSCAWSLTLELLVPFSASVLLAETSQASAVSGF